MGGGEGQETKQNKSKNQVRVTMFPKVWSGQLVWLSILSLLIDVIWWRVMKTMDHCVYLPLKLCVGALTPSVALFGVWVSKIIIKVKCRPKGRSLIQEDSCIRRDTRMFCIHPPSSHSHTPRKAKWRYSRKAVICKTGRELSLETDQAGTLNLDF